MGIYSKSMYVDTRLILDGLKRSQKEIFIQWFIFKAISVKLQKILKH